MPHYFLPLLVPKAMTANVAFWRKLAWFTRGAERISHDADTGPYQNARKGAPVLVFVSC